MKTLIVIIHQYKEGQETLLKMNICLHVWAFIQVLFVQVSPIHALCACIGHISGISLCLCLTNIWGHELSLPSAIKMSVYNFLCECVRVYVCVFLCVFVCVPSHPPRAELRCCQTCVCVRGISHASSPWLVHVCVCACVFVAVGDSVAVCICVSVCFRIYNVHVFVLLFCVVIFLICAT